AAGRCLPAPFRKAWGKHPGDGLCQTLLQRQDIACRHIKGEPAGLLAGGYHHRIKMPRSDDGTAGKGNAGTYQATQSPACVLYKDILRKAVRYLYTNKGIAAGQKYCVGMWHCKTRAIAGPPGKR